MTKPTGQSWDSPQWEDEFDPIEHFFREIHNLGYKSKVERLRSLIKAEREEAVRKFELKFRAYWNSYALKWQKSNSTQPVELIVKSTNRLLDQLVKEGRKERK